MLEKLLKIWRAYRHRFVPWIAFNLKHRSKRIVKGETEDKIVPDDVLLNSLLKVLPRLQPVVDGRLSQTEVAERNSKEIQSVLGFRLARASSRLQDAGMGVVVTSGCIDRGTLVALYPGTIYQPNEPILIPSIGNAFVLRCADGIHIDGNDRRISKIIYKACVGRESFKPFHAADLTWLTDTPVVFLNIGQYINNHSPELPANVTYQELNLPLQIIPSQQRCFLPNIWFRNSYKNDYLRLVALVSTMRIQQGEELFSTYYTIIH